MNKPKYLLISNSDQKNELLKALIEDNPNINYLGIKPYNKDLGGIIDHYDPDVIVINTSLDDSKRQVLKAYVQDKDVSVMFSSFGEENPEQVPVNISQLPPELVEPAINLSTDVNSLKVFLDNHFDSETQKSPEYIFVRSEKKMMKVSIYEITYIEALADYIKIFLDNGRKIITQRTMSSILNDLPSTKFIRMNRSNIVNGAKIDSFNSSSVYIGEKVIPIGKGYKEAFKALLKSY